MSPSHDERGHVDDIELSFMACPLWLTQHLCAYPTRGRQVVLTPLVMVVSCNSTVSDSLRKESISKNQTHIRRRRDRRSESPWIKVQAATPSGDLTSGKIAQAWKLTLVERFLCFPLGSCSRA